MRSSIVFLTVTACFSLPVCAGDWPTLLGPRRDGTSTEKGILVPWPKEGLKKLWDCELGIGYASPVVAKGRLFHFDRFKDNTRLTCRDAVSGKELWKFEYPMEYIDRYGYEPGPRASPVVDGDRIYLHGVEGMIHCLQVEDGKELWKLNTKEKYHFHQNFFGVGSVPIIDGDLLIVQGGGTAKGRRPLDFRDVRPNGTGFVTLDKRTGSVKYETGDELASYSSPTIATLNGKKTVLYFARDGLVGFDPQTGRQFFRFPWRARVEESVNAANPVIIGDKILLTECYGPGAALIDLKGGTPKLIWSDADKDRFDRSLACHWCTPIHIDGYVYGSSGREANEAELRCVELETGEIKWSRKRTFRCTYLLVDGYLVSLGEDGTLTLIKPAPEKYQELSRFEVPELVYPCWAPPVLSEGILYVRGKGRLVALELIPRKK
jgi:outer membrane protein assembly factor BamB